MPFPLALLLLLQGCSMYTYTVMVNIKRRRMKGKEFYRISNLFSCPKCLHIFTKNLFATHRRCRIYHSSACSYGCSSAHGKPIGSWIKLPLKHFVILESDVGQVWPDYCGYNYRYSFRSYPWASSKNRCLYPFTFFHHHDLPIWSLCATRESMVGYYSWRMSILQYLLKTAVA